MQLVWWRQFHWVVEVAASTAELSLEAAWQAAADPSLPCQ